MDTKTCFTCKGEFDINFFPKNRSYCFPCNRIKMNEHAFKRKDKRHQYNADNRDAVSEYNKEYYNENKEIFQTNYKKYLATNPQFKIIHNTRVRINKALKHNYKTSSSKELLGCDLDFYRQYLENQFKEDMTWENYGELWDIDHIKPCASFDLSTDEEQKKCFHYSNTQPLYKIENQRKNKY